MDTGTLPNSPVKKARRNPARAPPSSEKTPSAPRKTDCFNRPLTPNGQADRTSAAPNAPAIAIDATKLRLAPVSPPLHFRRGSAARSMFYKNPTRTASDCREQSGARGGFSPHSAAARANRLCKQSHDATSGCGCRLCNHNVRKEANRWQRRTARPPAGRGDGSSQRQEGGASVGRRPESHTGRSRG